MIGEREIALAALTVLDASPPQIVELAAAAGFDSITLRLADASASAPSPLAGDTPVLRETVAELRRHGLGVLDVEVIRLSAQTDLPTLTPVFESAAELGARNVLVICNEPDEPRMVACLHALCEQLSPYGMRAALEFMAFTECRTLQDAHRIVTATAHPAAAILVDPLHLARSGGTPAQVRELASAHPALFPYAQLCDAPAAAPSDGTRGLYREAVHRRLNPGEGELPLAELVSALAPATPLSVETPVWELRERSPAERARIAIAHTRRLLAEAS